MATPLVTCTISISSRTIKSATFKILTWIHTSLPRLSRRVATSTRTTVNFSSTSITITSYRATTRRATNLIWHRRSSTMRRPARRAHRTRRAHPSPAQLHRRHRRNRSSIQIISHTIHMSTQRANLLIVSGEILFYCCAVWGAWLTWNLNWKISFSLSLFSLTQQFLDLHGHWRFTPKSSASEGDLCMDNSTFPLLQNSTDGLEEQRPAQPLT